MTRKFVRPLSRRHAAADHARRAIRDVGQLGFVIGVAVATHTVFPALRWLQRRRIARGDTVWLEDMPGPPPTQTFPDLDGPAADLAPRQGKLRQARHMKTPYPDTDYPFAFRVPPLSGNVINGRGEPSKRRAGYVFFGGNYQRAWGKLDWYLQVMEPTRIHRLIVDMFWRDRGRVGPVARTVDPAPPEALSDRVKELATAHGAALVGITELEDTDRFRDFDVPFRYAIAVAIPMDREAMLHTPSDRSGVGIMEAYRDGNQVAIDLAASLRALGYPARASTNIAPDSMEVLHVPIAIRAGLGQLGKHGSLITAEYGANVRLATVLTDAPLTADTPVDLGVDDFCRSCRICETNCPPNALSPVKQLVRGEEKWYVDFDACIPYFAETGGCGICLQVCPWSEPGRGFDLRDKMLRRRERVEERPAAK